MNSDRKALIVEDDPEWQEILRDTLEQDLDCSVQVAATYQEAMEKLATDKFHLFTVDINLQADDASNQEGREVLKKLASLGVAPHAVVISGTSLCGALEDIVKEYDVCYTFRKGVYWDPDGFNEVVKKILANEG
jgi:CheY-like chemotaxis protein